MVNSKKLLSLFLAVVMIVSCFSVMASAYTRGDEVDGNINVKYTVEKVDEVPETEAGSEAYTADNIYAVHIWMKCSSPVALLTAPVHYNSAHFSPITAVMEGVTYPKGAGLTLDEVVGELGSTMYAYSDGDYMNNTGMYKADGSTGTKLNAKCIGYGNANASDLSVTTEFISPSHANYSKWTAGLPENTGVVYVNLDAVSISKGPYLNTISGITADTGWNRMYTFYFETLDGVTAADVVGDKFGVYTDDCFTVDGDVDASGNGYFVSATEAVYGTNPNKNVVSNAVVEAAAEPTIVNPLKGQMRYGDVVEGAQTYDVRALATITAADFNATFTDEATAKDMIDEIGFVFAAGSNVGTPDMAGVKALVENGTALDGYTKKTVNYLSSGVVANNYVFSCIVTGISETDAQANSLVAVGYIKWTDDEGTHYNYYPQAQTISYAILYNSKPAQA